MDEKLYALLKDQSFWSWLPREGGAYFDACFHMDWETVPAGEVRQSRGRMGYLISGRAHLEGSGGLVHAAGGEIFGIVQPGRRETRRAEETSLRAVKKNLLLCARRLTKCWQNKQESDEETTDCSPFAHRYSASRIGTEEKTSIG